MYWRHLHLLAISEFLVRALIFCSSTRKLFLTMTTFVKKSFSSGTSFVCNVGSAGCKHCLLPCQRVPQLFHRVMRFFQCLRVFNASPASPAINLLQRHVSPLNVAVASSDSSPADFRLHGPLLAGRQTGCWRSVPKGF